MDLEKKFSEIGVKLDLILTHQADLEARLLHDGQPLRESMRDFCRRHRVTRPTVYSWAEKGLIKLEKIGGRQFITASALQSPQKFQRIPQA